MMQNFSQLGRNFAETPIWNQMDGSARAGATSLSSEPPVWNSEIPGTTTYSPRCESIRTAEQYLLLFELPGQSKVDINVELDNDKLVVSGERRPSSIAVNGRLLHSEFYYGTFLRTFTLPLDANGEQIDASYNNGVLTVSVPRLADKKAKQVAIH